MFFFSFSLNFPFNKETKSRRKKNAKALAAVGAMCLINNSCNYFKYKKKLEPQLSVER